MTTKFIFKKVFFFKLITKLLVTDITLELLEKWRKIFISYTVFFNKLFHGEKISFSQPSV